MPIAALRKAKGSLEPDGTSPTAKHPTKRIELVGKRNCLPGNVSRNRIFKAGGLVVIVDGPGNFFRFSLRFCVEAADDSLKFGKFANHVRDEIALGKFGGTVCCADARVRNSAGEPLLGEPARQLRACARLCRRSCRALPER